MYQAIIVTQYGDADGATEDNYPYAIFTLDAHGEHAQLVRKYRTYRDAAAARDGINIVLKLQREA